MTAVYREKRDTEALPGSAVGTCQGCYRADYVVPRSDEAVELPSAKGSPVQENARRCQSIAVPNGSSSATLPR